MDIVDVFAHRGRFCEVLQETERSQTAVMTIAPGADAGPEGEPRSSTWWRARLSFASATPSTRPAAARSGPLCELLCPADACVLDG